MAQAIQNKVLTNVFNKKLTNAIDNSFWKQSQNDSAFVTGYDKILVPQFLDAIPQYDIIGATDWNAQVFTSITHTSREYAFVTRGFGPILITVLDSEELLYDKANAIMDEMMDDVVQYIAERITYNWTSVATNNVIPTTGTSTRGNVHGNTLIKRVTYQDWLNANSILDEQKVPREGRISFMNTRLYQDIKLMGEFDNADLLKTNILLTGQQSILDGVKIIVRETNNVFSLAGTALQPFGTAPIATDLGYITIYHPKFVRQAVGTNGSKGGGKFIVTYPSKVVGQPSFESYVRVGAAISYLGTASDDTGVVTIVESK